MSFLDPKIGENTKSIKRELIFADGAIIILGLLMVIYPAKASEFICWALGIILCIWGIIRIIHYFASPVHEIFGSFALVQGAAFIGFGVYFLANPVLIASLISVCLGIILIISGILKVQYTFDFMRLKTKFWLVELISSLLVLVLGVLTLVNPFGAAEALMLFIGIAFLVNGVWDLFSIIYLSVVVKKVMNRAKDNLDKAMLEASAIDVDYKDVK
ncbi:MAG: DUF308 domain-containing protein [Ruminiclostridium sp.]